MLAKHHHIDNSHKIEQVNIGSMYILNETELITNPYECDKSTIKTLEIKLEHNYDNYNLFFFQSIGVRERKYEIQRLHDLSPCVVVFVLDLMPLSPLLSSFLSFFLFFISKKFSLDESRRRRDVG